MDWERWVREGIIDELIANWFGDQKALLRQMLKVCEGKQVELAVASVLAGQGTHALSTRSASRLRIGSRLCRQESHLSFRSPIHALL